MYFVFISFILHFSSLSFAESIENLPLSWSVQPAHAAYNAHNAHNTHGSGHNKSFHGDGGEADRLLPKLTVTEATPSPRPITADTKNVNNNHTSTQPPHHQGIPSSSPRRSGLKSSASFHSALKSAHSYKSDNTSDDGSTSGGGTLSPKKRVRLASDSFRNSQRRGSCGGQVEGGSSGVGFLGRRKDSTTSSTSMGGENGLLPTYSELFNQRRLTISQRSPSMAVQLGANTAQCT